MDEMRDIAPEILILVMQPDRRAEAFSLHIHPDLANLVGGQLLLPPGGMQAPLELIESDLPYHRVQHILDLARQHDAALFGIGLFFQHRAEGELFAKHAGRLREGQRRIGQQSALRRGQKLMHPVAQLMGERHHIADITLIIQQQIGMHIGNGGMRESARRLAGADGRVNPRLFEKLLAQL